MLREIPLLEKEELVLLRALYFASQKVTVSYEELVKIIGEEDIQDFLLATEENKLLLPVSSSKSTAWRDRLLLIQPGENYRMPNGIRALINNLWNKGEWNPDYAIVSYFKQIGEPCCQQHSQFASVCLKLGMDLKRNLQIIQKGESSEWLLEQDKKWRCPKYGNRIIVSFYLKNCHWCGSRLRE